MTQVSQYHKYTKNNLNNLARLSSQLSDHPIISLYNHLNIRLLNCPPCTCNAPSIRNDGIPCSFGTRKEVIKRATMANIWICKMIIKLQRLIECVSFIPLPMPNPNLIPSAELWRCNLSVWFMVVELLYFDVEGQHLHHGLVIACSRFY